MIVGDALAHPQAEPGADIALGRNEQLEKMTARRGDFSVICPFAGGVGLVPIAGERNDMDKGFFIATGLRSPLEA